MYNILEGAIVNGQMPSKYTLELHSKQQFEEEARMNKYPEYTGYNTERSDKSRDSHKAKTNTSHQNNESMEHNENIIVPPDEQPVENLNEKAV